MLIEQDARQCDAQRQQHRRRGTELFFPFHVGFLPQKPVENLNRIRYTVNSITKNSQKGESK